MENNTFAMEILSDLKKQNKRIFITLIIVLIMWFTTIGIFVYYVKTTSYEDEYTTELETNTKDFGNGSINIDGDVINGKN